MITVSGRFIVLMMGVMATLAQRAEPAELLIGAGSVSITPSRAVALSGQRATRIASTVESPVVATAVALEARDGSAVVDQAIMVSCDLVAIRDDIQARLRQLVRPRLSDLNVNKLFLNATHTHTGPVTREGVYVIPATGVMPPAEYVEFLLQRLAELVVTTWEQRAAGGVGWGLGQAVVAHNRRAVYADGTARMYGATNGPAFRGIEGYEDHYVDVLFFFDTDQRLIAAAVNVPCPSQEVEGRQAVNADFWHEVRLKLRARFGSHLVVLAWTGASGDQSPHLMWYQRAEERMRRLRGLTRLEEIARRIDLAVDEAYQAAKQEIQFDVTFRHQVDTLELPVRMVTEQEYAAAKSFLDEIEEASSPDPRQSLEMMWNRQIVDRYARQEANPNYSMELHTLRLGDVAICTNPFELYTEYGIRIRARSPAVQTFVVQLACSSGIYLPTAEAVRGGHYSTAVYSNLVGPRGGDCLVDETVAAIASLWESTP